MTKFKSMLIACLFIPLTACQVVIEETPAQVEGQIEYSNGYTYDNISLDQYRSTNVIYSDVYVDTYRYDSHEEISSSQSVEFSLNNSTNTVAASCTITENEFYYDVSSLQHSSETLTSCEFLNYQTNTSWLLSASGDSTRYLSGEVYSTGVDIVIGYSTSADYRIEHKSGLHWSIDLSQHYYSAPEEISDEDIMLATVAVALYLFDQKMLSNRFEHINRANISPATASPSVLM